MTPIKKWWNKRKSWQKVISIILIVILSYFAIILFLGLLFISIPKEKFCLFDFECTRVRANCCGCQMGGQSTAVNWLYKWSLESGIEKNCGEVVCFAVYLCGNVKPACVKNSCELKYL